MYVFRTAARQRGGALCLATLVPPLLLLGLPPLFTATLAGRAIVSTAGVVILVFLLPESV